MLKKALNTIYYILISLRPKQRIKNLIIFIPLLFGGEINLHNIVISGVAFCLFSIFTGATYIINDIRDKDKDRQHPRKKNRPIASNKISSTTGFIVAITLLIIVSLLTYQYLGGQVMILFIGYLINTIFYSLYLKNIVIIDIFSISLGFVIRGLIGTLCIIDIAISPRFLIIIFFGALFLGFLKRYQEVMIGTESRNNISKYNKDFLKQVISMITTTILISYSMYTFNSVQSKRMIITLPIVAFGIIRYYYNIFYLNKYEENVEEIIFQDKQIMISGIIYVLLIFILVLM